MRPLLRLTRFSPVAVLAIALSACGIKGGLYLPPPVVATDHSKAPAPAPAASAPAAQSAPKSQP